MYCSQCGQAVGAQPNCPNCGAPTGFVGAPTRIPDGVPLPVSRVARHLHTVGILWTAYSAYLVLRWLLVLPFLHMALGGGRWMAASDTWMFTPFHPGGWLLHLITIVGIYAAPFCVGREEPADCSLGNAISAIIIAVLTLIKPLLGTILGDLYPLGGAPRARCRPELCATRHGSTNVPAATGFVDEVRRWRFSAR